MKVYHATLSLLLAAALPMLAAADDGVIEINQACAVNGGCFAGDSAGFPVTITNAGSYRLTGNLNVTVAADPPNTTAIEIDADGTFLDLNGHTISGPVYCTGTRKV